jgi:DNA polymerase-4
MFQPSLLSLENNHTDQQDVRKIVHIDMDAFFASVEQKKNPSLKGKPVIVGGDPNSRGVVAAASYEARRYGVRSAMSCAKAFQLCPHAVFVRSDFQAYKEASEQIQAIFYDYTPLVEPLSLDEAFLDLTDCTQERGSATRIAEVIRARIFETTGLTASAGISYNKFLAKMASDLNKPNGMATILPQDALAFIASLKVEKFHGIGSATAKKMHKHGIFLGEDLRSYSLADLAKLFGKAGPYYYNLVRGIDLREVKPYRERKSIGKERTFEYDIYQLDDLTTILQKLVLGVTKIAQEKKIKAGTVTVKIRYSDFDTITRSKKLKHNTNANVEIYSEAVKLLSNNVVLEKGVRLLGVSVHDFETKNNLGVQLDFFNTKFKQQNLS